MKTWQKWLVRVCKLKGTLDTEKVIREDKKRILELERENAELKSRLWYPGMVHVDINPFLKAQAQAQISAYEPPEKHTDPWTSVHQQLQHRRALMRHNTSSLARKIQLVGNEPQTTMLPSMTAPEDDWTNGGVDKTARHEAIGRNTGKAEM